MKSTPWWAAAAVPAQLSTRAKNPAEVTCTGEETGFNPGGWHTWTKQTRTRDKCGNKPLVLYFSFCPDFRGIPSLSCKRRTARNSTSTPQEQQSLCLQVYIGGNEQPCSTHSWSTCPGGGTACSVAHRLEQLLRSSRANTPGALFKLSQDVCMASGKCCQLVQFLQSNHSSGPKIDQIYIDFLGGS